MAQETKTYWGDKHQPFVKIGTDEEELLTLADAVVGGAWIAHAEIADLRALIKAVQSRAEDNIPASKDDVRVDADQDVPTLLVIHGGRIESCECARLDIRVTLTASTSFSGDAKFWNASFSGDADFARASFSGNAGFGSANFSGDASFRDARFGVANFGRAHFSGVANFAIARFSVSAEFWEARFCIAHFDSARFCGRATFRDASFSGEAYFEKASFSGDAYFQEASFFGKANFRNAILSANINLTKASFVGEVVLLDARRIDVRTVRFADTARRDLEREKLFIRKERRRDTSNSPSRWRTLNPTIAVRWLRNGPSLIKRSIRRRFGWTVVRGLGELAILTRVSLIALIAVPILAGLWPALRVAVNRYNRAMTEASKQFDQAADRLERAAENTDPALSVTIGEFGIWAQDWRDRFGEMTMDQPQLSWTLALAFFAAVGVTIGQLLYQINAPVKLRKEDEDEFVESIHKRYPEGAPDRNDGLRRATAALAAIARIRGNRHANFVDHHGETVWIPPGTRIDWFTDPKDEGNTDKEQVDAENPDGAQDARKGRAASGEGIIAGAERARIALEEGARAEYWRTGREKPFWAWMSFVFYCVAVLLLLWILIIQSQHVAKAAGWW